MVPESYRSPEKPYSEDSRMESKSTEREIGELVATVKAMATNSDRQFAEISREIEKLSAQFAEYKADHDKQSVKDYEYMDTKVGKIDNRVMTLEAAEAARKVAKSVHADSPAKKFLEKLRDVGATLAAGSIVAFVAWLILLYLKTSGVV